jgi:hypothetical protein
MGNFPCKKCGAEKPTEAGHDPCIANLPGVRNACCGHGDDSMSYVQFLNGTSIHGKFSPPTRSSFIWGMIYRENLDPAQFRTLWNGPTETPYDRTDSYWQRTLAARRNQSSP